MMDSYDRVVTIMHGLLASELEDGATGRGATMGWSTVVGQWLLLLSMMSRQVAEVWFSLLLSFSMSCIFIDYKPVHGIKH